jgi:hypothetical protein
MTYQMKTRDQVLVPAALGLIREYSEGLKSVTELVMHMTLLGIHVETLTDKHIIVMSEEDLANVDFVNGVFETRYEVKF